MKKILLSFILIIGLAGCSSNSELTKEQYVAKVVELNNKALSVGANSLLVGDANTKAYSDLANIYQEMADLQGPSEISKDEQTFDSKLTDLVKVCKEVSEKSKAGNQEEFSKSLSDFYKAWAEATEAGKAIDSTIGFATIG